MMVTVVTFVMVATAEEEKTVSSDGNGCNGCNGCNGRGGEDGKQ